jgi:hypothetical protein
VAYSVMVWLVAPGEQAHQSEAMQRTTTGRSLERVMNLDKSRIEMRISRSAWAFAISVSRIPKPFLMEFITRSSSRRCFGC